MNRLDKIRKEIKAKKWDALWISKPPHRRLLSGFTGSAGWLLVPASGKPWLMTDGRYQIQSRQEAKGWKVRISQQDPVGLLSGLLKSLKIARLGVEEEDVSLALWRRLRKLIPGLKGANATGVVEKVRAVKTPAEIVCLRRAAEIAERAFRNVWPRIRPGMTEQALAFELEKALHAFGAEGLSFPTIVASGPRSALPHGAPTDRRLRAGDLVVLDFGCVYHGYCSDLTRTVAIATISPRQKELYRLVKFAQKSAQKLLVSGKKAADSDKKARNIFRKEHKEKYFVHSLGHGLGLEVHEAPRLSSRSRDVLAAGMVVTCEPGLYFSGWGGIRIEDDVLIREDAPEWLSRSSAELPVAGRAR